MSDNVEKRFETDIHTYMSSKNSLILQAVRYMAKTYVGKFCFLCWQAVMCLQDKNTYVSTNAEQSVW